MRLVPLLAAPVLAAPGDTIAFQSSADLQPLLVFAAIAVSLSLLVWLLFKLFNRRKAANRAAARPKRSPPSLEESAATRGFRQSETRLLQQIASRNPALHGDILDSPHGRNYLMRDLEQRAQRRQREIEMIRRIQAKLEKMGQDDLVPRESVRVETQMRIWVAKKLQSATGDEEMDDVFTEIEPIAGRLRDISEGGAALRAEIEVGRGDLVEFWSADPDIALSPVTAAVVDYKQGQEGETLLHLHFMDPPLGELRSAIFALQNRED